MWKRNYGIYLCSNTSLNITLENTGKISARNPAIYMKLNGFRLGQDTSWKDWRLRCHCRMITGWREIIWSPTDNNIVHPHIPIRFTQLDFSNAIIEEQEELSIEVIIVADKFKVKKIKIPVEYYL